MPAYKDKEKGTWYASFYYEDWTGKKVKKMKRGFPTKREALEWERTFLQQQTADLEMTFENFVAVYVADMKGRIKENTWGTKEHILYKKLVPYFGKRKMCDIHSKEVIAWQNEMLNYRDKNGKPYSPVYLKTLHNQLSAVFNHAVRHYNLKVNPAAQVGNMGKPKSREMLFWTKAEYLKFAEAMMDKPLSYYAFEMLYWCGVREGELLALTPADFDFEKQTVTISKSYQRIKSRDVITDPKTPKSNRVIQKFDRLQGDYDRVREGNARLSDRLMEVKMENKKLRQISADYTRVKRVFGPEQVEAAVEADRQREQAEKGRKRPRHSLDRSGR